MSQLRASKQQRTENVKKNYYGHGGRSVPFALAMLANYEAECTQQLDAVRAHVVALADETGASRRAAIAQGEGDLAAAREAVESMELEVLSLQPPSRHRHHRHPHRPSANHR